MTKKKLQNITSNTLSWISKKQDVQNLLFKISQKKQRGIQEKAIQVAKIIQQKDYIASRWIAADALRELEKYLKEGKIKNIGSE